jgi:hypothetical protein
MKKWISNKILDCQKLILDFFSEEQKQQLNSDSIKTNLKYFAVNLLQNFLFIWQSIILIAKLIYQRVFITEEKNEKNNEEDLQQVEVPSKETEVF